MAHEVYLTFSQMANNAKLKKLIPAIEARGFAGKTLVFNLPSGDYSCPFARDCRATADKVTGRITNGEHQLFRCYAASIEARYPSLRRMVHRNLDLLKSAHKFDRRFGMHMLISESLDHAGAYDNGSVVRVHSHGEFWNRAYMEAWLDVARDTPRNRYYAYTKAVHWAMTSDVPDNFAFTFSRGGTQDHLIDEHGLKEAVVVGSQEEADRLGLEIDRDDSHALFGTASFALEVHGAGNTGFSAFPSIELQRV
jgi:hypothetical protein